MDPLWTPYGPSMDPLWTPYGPPMDPLWTPYGPSMDLLWTPYGPSMDPLWTPYGPFMALRVGRGTVGERQPLVNHRARGHMRVMRVVLRVV